MRGQLSAEAKDDVFGFGLSKHDIALPEAIVVWFNILKVFFNVSASKHNEHVNNLYILVFPYSREPPSSPVE